MKSDGYSLSTLVDKFNSRRVVFCGSDEIALPPFKRENYINKFLTLTEDILDKKESDRFLKTVQNLRNLKSGQLHKLNIEVSKNRLKRNSKKGIF